MILQLSYPINKTSCKFHTSLKSRQDINRRLEQELLQKYEDDLRNFVLDLDTSDREPVLIDISKLTYDMKPKLYLLTEKGHHEVTEHIIEHLNSLDATPEQIKKVNSRVDQITC